MSDHPKCIDISHWQGFPDFQQVRAAGVIAMIHKCSEGIHYIDPNRARNCANAIKAGIKVATYHWIKPHLNPASEMQYYLNALNPAPGERVVIDYEEEGCTLDQLKAAVEFLAADPRDLRITVYSGHLLKQQLGDKHDAFLADHTDLWLAQYTTGAVSWPRGTYPQWTLHQYSESGSVAGIENAKVDLNAFYGSDAQLLEWISPNAVTAKPPKLPEPVPEVAIDIVTPPGVAVTISLNGKQVIG